MIGGPTQRPPLMLVDISTMCYRGNTRRRDVKYCCWSKDFALYVFFGGNVMNISKEFTPLSIPLSEQFDLNVKSFGQRGYVIETRDVWEIID